MDGSKTYFAQKINPLVEKLIIDLVINKPTQVVDFMVDWLQSKGRLIEQQLNISPKQSAGQDSSDDEQDDTAEELFAKEQLIQLKKDKNARTSVSAEVFGRYNMKGDFKPKKVQKTEAQLQRIRQRLSEAFMFQALEESELKIVIDAMEEKQFAEDTRVIEQGADGDNLYLVEKGELECYRQSSPQDEPKLIKVYQQGELFGELALLYNAPRAATIITKTTSVLFTLDRHTFNHIVKDAAAKKRTYYELFLSRVELLQDIDPYEKLQIADALKSKKFQRGEYIVREGEQGDTFFLIEYGECIATKKNATDQTPEVVLHYKANDYFGELALLRNAPRAASVIAQNEVCVAYLDRNSFNRLIGPVENILRRNFKRYEKFMS